VADPPMRHWPAVDSDKGHTAIDKDRVRKLIKALEDDLKRYQGREGYEGTPNGVSDALNQITAASVGGGGGGKANGFPGGELMWRSIQSVKGAGGSSGSSGGFTGEYSAFIQKYSEVIDALYRAAGIQEEADNESAPTGTTTNSGNRSAYDPSSGT
jgi:hypothetical protein